MPDYRDVVIVGGGIGGSALAATLAGAGVDVLLLEQSARRLDPRTSRPNTRNG